MSTNCPNWGGSCPPAPRPVRLCVQINYKNLQLVNGERLLGVEIDHFLSWSSHVQKTHTTMIAKHIALLCRIKKYLPHQARQTFYHSFILPHMDYCSTLWGDSSAAERIHKLQKRAAIESLQTLLLQNAQRTTLRTASLAVAA